MSVVTKYSYTIGEIEAARGDIGMRVDDFAKHFNLPVAAYQKLRAGSPSEILPASMQEGADAAANAAAEAKVSRSQAATGTPDTATPDISPTPKPRKAPRSKSKGGEAAITTETSDTSDVTALTTEPEDKADTMDAITIPSKRTKKRIVEAANSQTLEPSNTVTAKATRTLRKKLQHEEANELEVVKIELDIAPAAGAENYASEAETTADADDGLFPLPPSDDDDNAFAGQDQLALLQSLRETVLPFAGKKKSEISAEDRHNATEKMKQLIAASRKLPAKDRVTFKIELLSELVNTFKIAKRTAEELWDAIDPPKQRQSKAERLKSEAEEDERLKEQEAEERREAEAEERERLEIEVKHVATDPKLMAHIIQLAHDEGVVREEKSVTIAVLTVTSRLTGKKRAMALLRLGAPSSGKNYVIDIVNQMLADGSVITMSGASEKALYYLGGEDECYLQHKVLYIPEAASIASRGGEEHGLTVALRNLLGERGELYFVTADVGGGDSGEKRQSREIRKRGPIAVLITSARENVEPELRTRLIEDYADETPDTTRQVQIKIAENAAGITSEQAGPYTLDDMRKFNRLLDLNGPQLVVIPYARTVIKLWHEHAQVVVRSRRDTSQIFAAIEASAILHQYQRQRDGDGRLIATVEDYTHAFTACERGMKTVASPEVKPEVIGFVEVLETLFAEQVAAAQSALAAWTAEHGKKSPADKAAAPPQPKIPLSVKATYEQLRRAMGVGSKETVAARATDALAAEAVERTDAEQFGSGRRPSMWTIKQSSKQLAEAASAVKVLPTPKELVEALAADKAVVGAIRDAA
jgi:hypothetical protein